MSIRNFTSVTKVYDINDSSLVVSYKVVENGITSFVPLDNNNKDKQAIDAWVADGNSIGEPA